MDDDTGDSPSESSDIQRRNFLKTTAVTGGVFGLTTGAADTSATPDTTAGGQGEASEEVDEAHIKLRGKVGGWVGVSPLSIEGEVNPTLDVEAGKIYTITWLNVDGATHNVVVVDADGYQIVRSNLVPEQGAVQSVEFEATADMGEYYCEIHPRSMRSDFDNVGPADIGRGDDDDRGIPTGATVQLEQVVDGLTHPLGLEVAPGAQDRLYILDQTGQVYIYDKQEGEVLDEPFLDIQDRIVELGYEPLGGYDERGLLGLAFHPDFEENRRFFVRYSAPNLEGTPEEYDHTEVLAEFRASEDGCRRNPGFEKRLMTFPSPQMNHNAGQIGFGPEDGYLYVTMGDGGGANDVGLGHVSDWYDENEGGNGQDVTQNLLGGIHRIDVDDQDGDKPYAIPDDNPLVGEEGLNEYYAWGLRNPWRMSFNDGELIVGDLGQNLFEEANVIEKGGNYGWNVREATHPFSTEDPVDPPRQAPLSTPEDVRGGEPLRDPVVEFDHRKTTTAPVDGNSIIGGYVYGTLPGQEIDTARELSPLQGKYVFGNWSNRGFAHPRGGLFAATPPETRGKTDDDPDDPDLWALEELEVANTEHGELNEFVQSLGRDHDGELYVLTSESAEPTGNSGKVYRFTNAMAGLEPEAGYGWLDAALDSYWYSLYNMNTAIAVSGVGLLFPRTQAQKQMFQKRLKAILKNSDVERPPVKNPNLNQAPFTEGDPHFTQKPVASFTVGDEHDHHEGDVERIWANTFAWDRSEMSHVVSPASLAWTHLKGVTWAKNFESHFGRLPEEMAPKFRAQMLGTMAQLAIKWALIEGHLRTSDDDFLLASAYDTKKDEIAEPEPHPHQQASMLWFLSDMVSFAENDWYGYVNPELLIPVKKLQQLADGVAKSTMEAFPPEKVAEVGSARTVGMMLGAAGWYGTHAGSEELREKAAEYASNLTGLLEERLEDSGKLPDEENNQAATQGAVGQGLLWASQIEGVDFTETAKPVVEYMLDDLWDDSAGTFADGSDDGTYTITAQDAADITGGLNAADAVLGWNEVQTVYAEYFNQTFNRGRLQRAQRPPSVDPEEDYQLPLPQHAGGEFGQSAVYNAEVTYDVDADEWSVTDDRFRTDQSLYLANQDVWIGHWGGSFYPGRGVPGHTDTPETDGSQ